MTEFAGAHWFSVSDYQAVLDVCRRLNAKRVLEFGPGSSTLALIEGGAERIDTLEDDPEWIRPAIDLLRDHRHVVTLIGYRWSDPLDILSPADRYDLCFIDGPRETARRPACVEFALQRCAAVLVALESNEGSTLMRDACLRLAELRDRSIEIWETGPVAGSFALLT